MGRENGASALSSDPTRALAYTIAKRKGHAASADTWMKQGAASNFAFIEPMNALRVRDLPVGDWLYEVKFDGYRALALKAGKEVRFVSRSTGLNNDYPQLILECQADSCGSVRWRGRGWSTDTGALLFQPWYQLYVADPSSPSRDL